jgi:hypothetical protein
MVGAQRRRVVGAFEGERCIRGFIRLQKEFIIRTEGRDRKEHREKPKGQNSEKKTKREISKERTRMQQKR